MCKSFFKQHGFLKKLGKKQRREITDKTTAEYRNINKEITKEMRKHKREKKTKKQKPASSKKKKRDGEEEHT